MKRAVTMWLAALLVLSLTACGGGASGGGEADASSSAEGGESLSFSAEDSQNSAPGEPGAANGEEASHQAGQNAKLIRRAELEIQTETFDTAADSLEALVAEAGWREATARMHEATKSPSGLADTQAHSAVNTELTPPIRTLGSFFVYMAVSGPASNSFMLGNTFIIFRIARIQNAT